MLSESVTVPTTPQVAPNAAALNAQGLALMKRQNYAEAADKLPQAAKLEPGDALGGCLR